MNSVHRKTTRERRQRRVKETPAARRSDDGGRNPLPSGGHPLPRKGASRLGERYKAQGLPFVHPRGPSRRSSRVRVSSFQPYEKSETAGYRVKVTPCFRLRPSPPTSEPQFFGPIALKLVSRIRSPPASADAAGTGRWGVEVHARVRRNGRPMVAPDSVRRVRSPGPL